MRRLLRSPAVVLLVFAILAIPASPADKAKKFFEQGQDADARQNYEAAYEFYKQAYDLKPKDLRYRAVLEKSAFRGSFFDRPSRAETARPGQAG